MQECFKTVCHEVPAICNQKSKETIALCKISNNNNNNNNNNKRNEEIFIVFYLKKEERSEEMKTSICN